MLNILINFATMKAGGGQNVALNFLHAIRSLSFKDIEITYMVAKGSETHRFLMQQSELKYVVVPANPVARILSEILICPFLLHRHRLDIVYSYFGYAFFLSTVPQVCGCAVSNLFFPEIDFWHGHRGLARLQRLLVDKYRRFAIRRASAVIFENALLEERSKQLFGLLRTRTIRPSIHVAEDHAPYPLPADRMPNTKRGLFLCGWALNKNVMLIPEIAAALRQLGQPFNFVLTAPNDDSPLRQRFLELAEEHHVADMIMLPGGARKDQLASLYAQVDFVFLLSKLESFSNNIIEAWYFNKPLIVADEPWARALCMDSAEYVDRESPIEIAQTITKLINNPERVEALVHQGYKMLKGYPDIKERINQELQYLRDVHETL
jgi:glycosyltransferase involved in cell wall biosynthesis